MPFGRFLPREYSFFDLFEEHAARSHEAAVLLNSMANDLSDVERNVREIKDLEHEGDRITHQTVETLRKTFITPFDREEIHRLISRMDDILDFIDATSQRVILYEIKEFTAEGKELCEVLVRATEQVKKAVTGLRSLRNPKDLIQTCVEINRLENDGDTALRNGMAALFRNGKDPIFIIKWKEIYEFMEVATDRCEDVANIIEGVVLDRS